MLRWGILGAANIARKMTIPAIQRSTNGRAVAIAARDIQRARAAAAELEIERVADSYDALLADPGVDAVYIPLPNSEHLDWTLAALAAGKHVLCEKPLALDARQAQQMADAAQGAGLQLGEAFMYRHHPVVGRVLELIRQGAIGEPRLVRSTFSFGVVREGNIRLSAELGGGALMDVGCYGVNLARLVTGGEPLAYAALAHYGPTGVDTDFAGVLRFEQAGGPGVLAEVVVSLRANGGPSYDIIGESGKIVVPGGFKQPPDAPGLFELTANGTTRQLTTEAADQFQLMVEAFGRAVLENRPFPYPPSDAVANMQAIDALREAARAASG